MLAQGALYLASATTLAIFHAIVFSGSALIQLIRAGWEGIKDEFRKVAPALRNRASNWDMQLGREWRKKVLIGYGAIVLAIAVICFCKRGEIRRFVHRQEKKIAVREASRKPLPPMPASKRLRMGKNFQGAGMWIWKIKNAEGGDTDRIIEKCNLGSLTYILVKTNDGCKPFGADGRAHGNCNHTLAINAEFVRKLNNAGIVVHGWSYNHCNMPKAEADQVIRALHDVGVNGFAYDTEGDVKNKKENAKKMCEIVRDHIASCSICRGKKIAYAPFRNPFSHRALPYEVFGKFTDVMMPQLYWYYPRQKGDPVDNFNASYAQWLALQREWRKNGNGESIKPIIPLGQTMYNAPASDIRRWLHVATRYGGFCFWKWEDTSYDQWQAIGEWRRIQQVELAR